MRITPPLSHKEQKSFFYPHFCCSEPLRYESEPVELQELVKYFKTEAVIHCAGGREKIEEPFQIREAHELGFVTSGYTLPERLPKIIFMSPELPEQMDFQPYYCRGCIYIFLVKNPRLCWAIACWHWFPPHMSDELFILDEHEKFREYDRKRGCCVQACYYGEGPELPAIQASTILKAPLYCEHNVEIEEYCVLGGAAFNYEYLQKDFGSWVEIPQYGSVLLEEGVHLYSHVTIDRATLPDHQTRIGAGSKIDNHVHIAGNCVVGRNNVILAGAILCGGVKTGVNCVIAPGAIIRENITIGHNVTVGTGAVVVKDVPDDATVYGNPAATPEQTNAARLKAIENPYTLNDFFGPLVTEAEIQKVVEKVMEHPVFERPGRPVTDADIATTAGEYKKPEENGWMCK